MKITEYCLIWLLCITSKGSCMNAFTLTSPDFNNNQDIPQAFTCDGENRMPSLEWSNAPAGTKSFALICADPDAPGKKFIHWAAYNIPANQYSLDKTNISNAIQLPNDFGEARWKGPCPPLSIRPQHRYIFTVYALNIATIPAIATYHKLMRELKKYTIDKATLTGLYKRASK